MNTSNIIDTNSNKVFMEDGEVKTTLNENAIENGYISVEESRKITLEAVRIIFEQNESV